jgi:Signal peptidase, peptidase S26
MIKSLKVLRALWMGLISFVMIGLLSLKFSILKSTTDSLPYHYFLEIKNVKPVLNDLTVVYSKHLKTRIIKKVLGIEGDKLFYDDKNNLWLNQQLIGNFAHFLQKKLTPIKAQVIARRYVFLHCNHEFSFDSRYQELGLVSQEQLTSKVIPLW